MKNAILKDKKYYLRFTLYFLGFGLLIAIIVSFINYKLSLSQTQKKFQTMAYSEILDKQNYLKYYISQAELLLISATQSEFTQDYIKFESSINKQNLNNFFYGLANSNKDIMQLRYIDANGKEKIRVDRDKASQNLKIIKDENLQDKSDRYYFKEALELSKKQFWHSNLDLNIERGKIEIPYKPTFRIATKIMVNNHCEGIIIVNLLFKETVEILSHSKNFDIFLIDNDGEIIHTPDHKDSWSKYLKNGNSLQKVFPIEANNILNNAEYSTPTLHSFAIGDLFKNKENLKVVFQTKTAAKQQQNEENTHTALIVALTVLFVSIPLSWIVSIIPSTLQTKLADSYEKIRKSSKIIDKYIMTSKTDANGISTDISSKFTDITGYSRAEVIGKKHNLLRHPDTEKELYDDLWNTITNGRVWENEIKDRDKFGKDFWIHMLITPEFDNNGNIIGYTEIAQDITDKKTIEQMSKIDPLTELYNRREIESLMQKEISLYERYQTNFSILFIDIDKFKNVNDTFGHNIGDDVLVEVSNILKDSSRETDTVGRWGGEEFIILSSQTDIDGAFEFANHIRQNIEKFDFPTVKTITISCGISQYKKGDSISGAIARADEALYRAKENGRNRVERG